MDQVCKSYAVTKQGKDTWADFILLDMLDFDVILGMDRLASSRLLCQI